MSDCSSAKATHMKLEPTKSRIDTLSRRETPQLSTQVSQTFRKNANKSATKCGMMTLRHPRKTTKRVEQQGHQIGPK
jgi:hypothetical protein